ncbi:MAG: HAD-IIIC family phosphatase [Candidatus Solibacter usitatus]|nr:HAD-IIIC family phosphatase [Candidatus Solibacter usitatus]
MIDPSSSLSPQERIQPQPFRIAIAANFTADPVRASLAFWGRELDAGFEIVFAPYNQMVQTLLDPGSEFGRNTHGINVVLVRYEELAQFDAPGGNALSALEAHAQELAGALAAASRHAAPLMVCVCPSSPGFLSQPANARSLERMRLLLAAPGVQYLDDVELARLYPVEQVEDGEAGRIGHIPYSETFFAALGTAIARRAHSLFMPPYKVVAVDCDNTLWDGICGEDGPSGVTLDPPRRALHKFLLAQREAGMLLALASKNNEQDVLDTFAAHPEFPLQLSHFAAWRLNWDSKADSLTSLATEFNIGLDAFVFIDDNPKECAEVAQGAPEALSLTLPGDAGEIPAFLAHIWAFDHRTLTAEDQQRSALVANSLEFGRAARQAASLAEFIASLDLRVDFQPLDPERLGRVAQLTLRTNQFNTTTIRRSETEIQALLATGNYRTFTAEVSDRFGEYGLVGVLIVRQSPADLFVDSFLLSCRALGRGVEHRMLSALAEEALDNGIYTVSVAFRPSARNLPAYQFLESIPFGRKHEGRDETVYSFPVSELQSLRWKAPAPESGQPPAPRGGTAPSRRFTGYARIAADLRSPVQVLQTIRRQAQAVLHATPEDHPDAPSSAIERQLAVIWTELLERPVTSASANFFDLGGHSLLAVLLLMRVKEAFSVELSVDDVYSGTLTLSELARTIEARQLGALDPDEYQALLAEIEGLSDDEVRVLLEQEPPPANGS